TDQASAAEDGTLNTWRSWPSSRTGAGTSETVESGKGKV
ncbi:hypothetical protein FOQG_17157, partial [Fusarium oxysporum f. sp. raphani 54005]